jgi:protein O-mannosyl-transferase
MLKLSLFLPRLVCFVLLICTVQRNAIYANEVAFWGDAVRKSPGKARPHNNLGNAYFLAGDLDRAIEEFRVASQLDPSLTTAK